MAKTDIQVLEPAGLGIRFYYWPPAPQSTGAADEFSYYSHKHPYYELHLILEGTLTMEAAGQRYTLKTGEFCLFSPGVVHAPKSDVTQAHRYCIGFDLTEQTEPADFLRQKTRQAGVHTGDARQMRQTLELLEREAASGGPFSTEMTGQLLARLALQMLRQMALSDPSLGPKPADLNSLRTVHIDNFLNNSFHLQGAQQRLARELGISRRQLDRVFHALYGKGFREKLLEVRAAAACDLLRGDLSVEQIAQHMGYSTGANFTAFFKSVMGMTPTQYRQNFHNH